MWTVSFIVGLLTTLNLFTTGRSDSFSSFLIVRVPEPFYIASRKTARPVWYLWVWGTHPESGRWTEFTKLLDTHFSYIRTAWTQSPRFCVSCTCVNVYGHTWTRVHMWKLEVDIRCLPCQSTPYTLTPCLTWTWDSAFQLGWLVHGLQQSSYLCLPRAELAGLGARIRFKCL